VAAWGHHLLLHLHLPRLLMRHEHWLCILQHVFIRLQVVSENALSALLLKLELGGAARDVVRILVELLLRGRLLDQLLVGCLLLVHLLLLLGVIAVVVVRVSI